MEKHRYARLAGDDPDKLIIVDGHQRVSLNRDWFEFLLRAALEATKDIPSYVQFHEDVRELRESLK